MLELRITSSATISGDDIDYIRVWGLRSSLGLYSDEVLESLARVELSRFYGAEAGSYRLRRDWAEAVGEHCEAVYRVEGNG